MTDRPSIAELQRIEREELAPAPWRYDHQGWIETVDRGIAHSGGETEVLTLGARNSHEDGENTAAIRNAAPVLLEIAAAALAWRAMKQRKLSHLHDPEEQALYDALAKVRP